MENRANWLVVGALGVLIAGLVVAAVLITRDGEEAADGRTTTTSPTTTTVESTTSTTQATTTTAALSPEDEIRRSAAELFERREQVLMDPDPAHIQEYAVDQSPLYANDLAAINHLVATNARHATDTAQVLGVRVESTAGGSPRLTVVIEYGEADIVNDAGDLLEQLPPGRAAYSVSLLGSRGSWRINDFFVLDQLLPSEMDEVISLGVP